MILPMTGGRLAGVVGVVGVVGDVGVLLPPPPPQAARVNPSPMVTRHRGFCMTAPMLGGDSGGVTRQSLKEGTRDEQLAVQVLQFVLRATGTGFRLI